MVVWGLASLAAAAAWSLPVLMACRFLIGVGVGGEAPVAQAMVSEIVPANVRGKYIAFMEGFWAIGYVLSGAISFFVLPYLGWRWAFVIVGLLSMVVLLVRRSMPESPRWLADKGRHAEAEAVMATMEREVERATGRPLPPVAPSLVDAVTAPVPYQNPIATLFSPEYRLRTVMAFGMWFFTLIGFFGLNSWIAVLPEGAWLLDRRLGRFRDADHGGWHPRLLHCGATLGEDRAQAHYGGLSHLFGDRCIFIR